MFDLVPFCILIFNLTMNKIQLSPHLYDLFMREYHHDLSNKKVSNILLMDIICYTVMKPINPYPKQFTIIAIVIHIYAIFFVDYFTHWNNVTFIYFLIIYFIEIIK